MKNIILVGASGHAKMIIDIVKTYQDYNIIGYVDSFKTKGTVVYGYEILGNLKDIISIKKKHNIEGVVICIGDNHTRKVLKDRIDKFALELSYMTVIHPSAIITPSLSIPEGTVIMAGVIINSDAKIGAFCILNTNSSLGHDSVMGDFSSLASGVTVGGNVKIGFCSAICIGVTIIQNISIGDYTVIGATSLVLKSIGNCKQAYGVPINQIKDRKPDSKYLG